MRFWFCRTHVQEDEDNSVHLVVDKYKFTEPGAW